MPFIEAIGIAKHRTEQKPARTDNVYQPFHTLFRFVIYLAAVNVHPVALSRKGVAQPRVQRAERTDLQQKLVPCAAARRSYLRKHVRAVLKHTVRSARAPTGAAEAAALPGSPCGVILPPDDCLRLVGPEGLAQTDRRLTWAPGAVAVSVGRIRTVCAGHSTDGVALRDLEPKLCTRDFTTDRLNLKLASGGARAKVNANSAP